MGTLCTVFTEPFESRYQAFPEIIDHRRPAWVMLHSIRLRVANRILFMSVRVPGEHDERAQILMVLLFATCFPVKWQQRVGRAYCVADVTCAPFFVFSCFLSSFIFHLSFRLIPVLSPLVLLTSSSSVFSITSLPAVQLYMR